MKRAGSRERTAAASWSALCCMASVIARCQVAVVARWSWSAVLRLRKISGLWSVQKVYSMASVTTSGLCVVVSESAAATAAAPGRMRMVSRGSEKSPCGVMARAAPGDSVSALRA